MCALAVFDSFLARDFVGSDCRCVSVPVAAGVIHSFGKGQDPVEGSCSWCARLSSFFDHDLDDFRDSSFVVLAVDGSGGDPPCSFLQDRAAYYGVSDDSSNDSLFESRQEVGELRGRFDEGVVAYGQGLNGDVAYGRGRACLIVFRFVCRSKCGALNSFRAI